MDSDEESDTDEETKELLMKLSEIHMRKSASHLPMEKKMK